MLSYRHHVTDKVLSWRPKHTTMDTKKIREAVELLESMDPLSDSNVYDRIYELAAIIRAELDAAPKVKGLTAEPVAWMSDDGEPISARRHEDMEHAEHPLLVHYSTPLYLAPAAGLTVEEVERANNVKDQCIATAWDGLSGKILVDGGSGTMRELLCDAHDVIRYLLNKR